MSEHARSDEGPPARIVLIRDEEDWKEFHITDEGKLHWVMAESQLDAEGQIRWRWYFWGGTSPFRNPPPFEWPTLEQTLEAAVRSIGETLDDNH